MDLVDNQKMLVTEPPPNTHNTHTQTHKHTTTASVHQMAISSPPPRRR